MSENLKQYYFHFRYYLNFVTYQAAFFNEKTKNIAYVFSWALINLFNTSMYL